MRKKHYESSSERIKDYGLFAGFYAVAFGAAVAVSVPAQYGAAKLSERSYDGSDAQEYLEDAGYTDVEYQDTSRLFVQLTGCGRDDVIKFEFEAIAPATGREVQLAVCDNIFKGATIRQD